MKLAAFTSHGTLKKAIDEAGKMTQPPLKTIAKCEQVLAQAFVATDAAVHVITGSLKLSGHTSSDYEHGKTWNSSKWTGSIIYGGPSAGPNNPVTYAVYEMARGGAHDFLAPAMAFAPQFEAAIQGLASDH